jgi:hypothetical protein
MACNEDFVFGHGRDELLNQLHDEIPDAFQDDSVSMMAALLWLDERYGLRKDGDYVLVTPGLAVWLIFQVTVDSEVQRMMDAEDDEGLLRLTTEKPFEVKCESFEGPEYTLAYPETIRGKTVLVRVMNEREASQLSIMYTVRADGTFIYLPGIGGRPTSVQELQP